MYHNVRPDGQVDNLRNWAADGINTGTKYSGMSYEQGIEDTLAWLFGDTDENPTGEMI
jgi:hypothetical protein